MVYLSFNSTDKYSGNELTLDFYEKLLEKKYFEVLLEEIILFSFNVRKIFSKNLVKNYINFSNIEEPKPVP